MHRRCADRAPVPVGAVRRRPDRHRGAPHAPRPQAATRCRMTSTVGTRFRPAAAPDLPAVVAAYNAGIAERVATFETEPRTVADVGGWLTDGQPFIVAERGGEVAGFARAGV